MGEPNPSQIAPANPILPPTAPAKPAAPTLAFATCSSDDAVMQRLHARNTDDPAYKKKGVRKPADWFPSGRVPSSDNQVIAYVHGICAFADMAEAIVTAFLPEHRIYILGWSTDKGTQLKPGPGNTLEDYLKNTRAQVRGMFYDGKITLTPLIKVSTDVENQWIRDAINQSPNGAAVIDSKLPPLGIHHQKLLVVQGQFGLIGFIGGMDFGPSRIDVEPSKGLPYHDTQLRIAGPAALECRKVFEDRWLDHPLTGSLDQKLGALSVATIETRRSLAFPPPSTLSLGSLPSVTLQDGSKRGAKRVQVAVGRTFANLRKWGGSVSYGFAPDGDYGAWALIEQGIKQSTRWIYLEDQYLVSRMARKALLEKMKDPRFEFLLMLINNSGAAANDFKFLVTARNEFRRDLLKIDPKQARWGMFTLKDPRDKERQQWCGSYVHSKTWVFDDGYVVVGSANCDNRGYTHDTEVVAGITDTNTLDVFLGESFAIDLRTRLWHKHLGLPHNQVRDWDKGIKFWKKPSPSAMIVDASALEPDYDLVPVAQFPSASDANVVDKAWTMFIDPDSR